MPSIQLELLSANVPGDGKERLPLSALTEDETHVHGELAWTIGERHVPDMGFWGPHDVCLGEWWDELSSALAALAGGQPYTLDSGEQGSSAFLFERTGATVRVSIVAGISGGRAHPEWQNVEFGWDDLVTAVARLKRDLAQRLKSEGPPGLPEEWRRRLGSVA